jgi:hypothetical protein
MKIGDLVLNALTDNVGVVVSIWGAYDARYARLSNGEKADTIYLEVVS